MKKENPSLTPRTDAAVLDTFHIDAAQNPRVVNADFARAIERENAHLRDVLKIIKIEALEHAEKNQISGITRLPNGYSEIVKIVKAALNP